MSQLLLDRTREDETSPNLGICDDNDDDDVDGFGSGLSTTNHQKPQTTSEDYAEGKKERMIKSAGICVYIQIRISILRISA